MNYIYTKSSYSHNAPKKLLFEIESDYNTLVKISQLQKEYPGVIFFSKKTKEANGQ